MSHDHNSPLGHHHLGSLAFLAAFLLLPPDLLMRAMKRLAILVVGFVGLLAVTIGAYAVFNPKPLCYLGREIASPPSNDPQACKEYAAKAEAEGRAAMAELERVLERDRPRKP